MFRVKSLINWSIRLFLLFFAMGVIGITVTWLVIAPSLPSVETLRDVRLQVPLRIYTADGLLIQEIGEQRRIPIRIEDAPEPLVQAFLAAEDDRFYSHPGIDWRGTARAVWLYGRSLGQGQVPGGSTITQQVARRFFLSTEYSVTRKLREMMLALKIEREMEKDEILELYLNKEFLGHRAYGVGAAAHVYYGKTLDELTVAESAMLAALPKTPSRVNPITNPQRAALRRDWILGRMLNLGYITEEEHAEAVDTPPQTVYHGLNPEVSAPWVAEMARRQAVEVLGEEEAYGGGYEVYTTVKAEQQSAAIRSVRNGLLAYDRRHGWRGPEARIDESELEDRSSLIQALRQQRPVAGLQPAVVMDVDSESDDALLLTSDGEEILFDLDDVAWARPFINRNAMGPRPESVDQVLARGDMVRVMRDEDGEWRLSQLPEAESALVSMDPYTGEILALVGGLDYGRSQFNRVVQSRRQPGSAFKPFIYAAALDNGYTPASLVNDAPVVMDDPSMERVWRPTNFSERFYGPTRLREAMVHSRNLVSVRLLMGVGLEDARDYISDFGFNREHLPPGMSMALGSASLTPLEMNAAYAVFANGGYAVRPNAIHSIVEAGGGSIVWEPRWQIACPGCPEITPPPPPPVVHDGLETRDGPTRRTLRPGVPRTEPEAEDEPEIHGPPRPDHAPRILSEQTTFLIRSMLSEVITSGTGRRALELGRNDLAGKTGTTNDQRDVWFVGFNDAMVASVWVGLDSHESLGRQEQGGRTALPIWVDYMSTALNGVPERETTMPSGLARLRIDPETGLRARPDNPRAVQEFFHADNLPPLEPETRDNGEQESSDPYDIF